jgi:UDP-GlcNAc:undecaprenyl-phosphate GlcNAc-1-phosphate transferase
VVTVTNAVNILDNMDGVATGVVAVAATGFFAMAAFQGDYVVASFALALAGGSLGFLVHNFPPAKVFMGDAGSLMLGFLLAVLSLKLDAATPHEIVRAVVAVLAVGVPLFDLALVILARSRGGRPIFKGGLDHAAHRLSASGLSGRHVALAAYVSQGFATAGAIVTLEASGLSGAFAASLGTVVALTLLAIFLRMDTLPHADQRSSPVPADPQPRPP